ncbi:MAG: hypothetical protein ACRDRS_17845 [Pseudonocardiaceae bacterium]
MTTVHSDSASWALRGTGARPHDEMTALMGLRAGAVTEVPVAVFLRQPAIRPREKGEEPCRST